MRSNPTPKTLADRLLSTTPARSVLSTFSPQTVTPNVIGKRFELTMLSNVMVYEVIGMKAAKGQATTYTLQYEGDGDPVIEEGLKHEELLDMLEFSRPLDEGMFLQIQSATLQTGLSFQQF